MSHQRLLALLVALWACCALGHARADTLASKTQHQRAAADRVTPRRGADPRQSATETARAPAFHAPPAGSAPHTLAAPFLRSASDVRARDATETEADGGPESAEDGSGSSGGGGGGVDLAVVGGVSAGVAVLVVCACVWFIRRYHRLQREEAAKEDHAEMMRAARLATAHGHVVDTATWSRRGRQASVSVDPELAKRIQSSTGRTSTFMSGGMLVQMDMESPAAGKHGRNLSLLSVDSIDSAGAGPSGRSRHKRSKSLDPNSLAGGGSGDGDGTSSKKGRSRSGSHSHSRSRSKDRRDADADAEDAAADGNRRGPSARTREHKRAKSLNVTSVPGGKMMNSLDFEGDYDESPSVSLNSSAAGMAIITSDVDAEDHVDGDVLDGAEIGRTIRKDSTHRKKHKKKKHRKHSHSRSRSRSHSRSGADEFHGALPGAVDA